ncbi:MAG: hypothetical protein QME64_06450, partial [bacterium]|nr:hypothetical protein [bacterium]
PRTQGWQVTPVVNRYIAELQSELPTLSAGDEAIPAFAGMTLALAEAGVIPAEAGAGLPRYRSQ